ncbi:quinol:cytochrome c oxidoreductase iron-sulfur protein precursor [Pseudomonas synxantha]|uniref:Tetrathionate reductase subunit B n=1 Tax=Pseudomonas synxantha TaxID=47883 RepID=A0AAX3I812_9PSED|nr:TAT-variant-translocated molybdopterin oxidoreductase [Pseudomonas synxantha]AZE67167.1 Molybdopterin oxidoreductase, iron-sulfur binding subunit [Pseudomonas synxantha]KRP55949.1 molybdopterin oxidoreductase [Pseudomonas synxantha]SDU29090.1 quinol:cytochrome c oxidoreductase iron-sulfur protein precursor [Pseudomonas synxantha]VTQ99462.1 tetrathionate reductase subunit B [Pseudomonas synxantha]
MSAPLDFVALRGQLAGLKGRAYWRGLEALSASPEVQALMEAEFPGVAPLLDRRGFLQLMAASLAMAGLAACGKAPEQAITAVHQPATLTPGVAAWYATAVSLAGVAQPVLAKTQAGRPIKLEGNPAHPMSGGACDAFTQAAILQLYDPDRSQAPRWRGRETSWAQVRAALSQERQALDRLHGKGLHIVCGASSSPTLQRQFEQLQKRWPEARLYHGEAFAETTAMVASEQLFGQPLTARVHLEHAQVLVCLDYDPLGCGPYQTVRQSGWAERRRRAAKGEGAALSFVAESVPTLTGAAATARLPMPPSRLPDMLLALSQALGETLPGTPRLTAAQRQWLDLAVAALKAHPGRGLIGISSQAPEALQAQVLRLNQRLGHLGRTLDLQAPSLLGYEPQRQWASLQQLAQALQEERVSHLVMLDCNPVQLSALPAQLQQVPMRLHAGLYYDESAAQCHWHLPLNHGLDGWSDARAADGSACIVQPLIEPLYATRTLHQVLELLMSAAEADGLALVRATWAHIPEAQWRQALAQGWIETAAPSVAVRNPGTAAASLALSDRDGLQALVRPDPTIWDGRFANCAWLQELPKPISTLTWSNVVGLSPRLAERLGVGNGDGVEVSLTGQTLRGPAWVEPGQADEVIALYAGYGRTRAGRVGNDLGYAVRPIQALAADAKLRVTGEHYRLATTQAHHQLPDEDEPPIRVVARDAPHLPGQTIPVSLYSPAADSGPQWGMVIDLDLCTGCNACVVACQAENNIAVVGAEQVARGRNMHWLRIDHYYQGSLDAPRSRFQPLPCMHCEQAPCETGCPVNATVHSRDGLNQMVYNRCIGTRTCAAYCPYKVRRFNWLDWSANAAPSIQAQRNPEVTVRSRGVMEKCTYCIQRISAARIEDKQQAAAFDPSSVVTACQQTCPSQAIRFGDIADPASDVSQARRDPRHYRLLDALGTRPRTSYLARIEEEGTGDAS